MSEFLRLDIGGKMGKDSDLQKVVEEAIKKGNLLRVVPEWKRRFRNNIEEKEKGSFEERMLAGLDRIIELLEDMINPIPNTESFPIESDAIDSVTEENWRSKGEKE